MHARLLAVGGEEQVVASLRDRLPPRCQEIFAEEPGRRETQEEFEQVVADAAAERSRAEHDELVERFGAIGRPTGRRSPTGSACCCGTGSQTGLP